jgi:hypothetical protein
MNFTKELPAGEASHAARPRIAGTAADEPRPGNPYDGHTLGVVIEDTERLAGCEIERVYVDKDIVVTARPIHSASSSPTKSAASSASSSAN